LWLGYQAIHWGSLLPGAAITLPSPDWLQITAFWVLLILVFPPHRNALTWGGAALAGLLLAVSVTWPFLAPPQDLEITCLDSPVGLDGVIVAPPHHRLAFSAAWETWPGKPARAGGPLPSYLYWRQWRRLDTVLALRLNQGNAAELLTIVQELSLGEFFYGGYGGKGPAYLALLNTLGDQRKPARRVRVGQPPLSLGDARLNLLQIQDGKALALHLNYQGRQVLLLPPLGRAAKAELPAIPGPLEVLVTASEGSHLLVAQMQPRHLILYGRPPSPAATAADCRLPVLATRDGTVTIRIARDGTTLSQWRP
jgi:beta-lactamase superfamily II metal-dependent hydrolase